MSASRPEPRALAQLHAKESVPIVLMLFCALALFVAGIFRPFTEVTKLWIFQNQISVYEGLITLARDREYFLFSILLVFTIIFPFVKILSLVTLWLVRGLGRKRIVQLYGFVSHLGKWSMLDVFVVANLVLLLKAGSLATIQLRDGCFLFFASVMLTQLASLWIGLIARRAVE